MGLLVLMGDSSFSRTCQHSLGPKSSNRSGIILGIIARFTRML